jgi:hypothetical protein
MNAWRADPLVWGHGTRIFEVFLEPTCPFSVKTFGKTRRPARPGGRGRIAPPLTATEAEIDFGLELLDAALEQTLENLHPFREAPVFPPGAR